MNFDFTTLPESTVTEAPAPKERKMPSGPKSNPLPQHVIDKLNTPGVWIEQTGLQNGRAAKAFIYAVRQYTKKKGNGLKVGIASPEMLLKDLTLDTPGPITLSLCATDALDTRRGRKATTPDTLEEVPDVEVPEEEPVGELEKLLAEIDAEDEVLEEVSEPVKSPGAFVDPDEQDDAEWDARWANV